RLGTTSLDSIAGGQVRRSACRRRPPKWAGNAPNRAPGGRSASPRHCSRIAVSSALFPLPAGLTRFPAVGERESGDAPVAHRRLRNRRDGSQGRREPRLAALLVRLDLSLVAEGEADVVEALHEPPAGVVVDL